MATIKINDTEITRPPELELQREDLYSGEYTTCTGSTIADVIGWKYSDLTLKWDAITDDELQVLLAMSGECTIEFTEADTTVTESIIRTGAVYMEHRWSINGVTYWSNVEVSISFITAHSYEE